MDHTPHLCIHSNPYAPDGLLQEQATQHNWSNSFQGLEGQQLPEMSDAYIETVSQRYIELYENILGKPFLKAETAQMEDRILANIQQALVELP